MRRRALAACCASHRCKGRSVTIVQHVCCAQLTSTAESYSSLWSSLLARGAFTGATFVAQLSADGVDDLCEFIERVLLDRPCELPVE